MNFDIDRMVEWFNSCIKTPDDFSIGFENERFGVDPYSGWKSLPYRSNGKSIENVLKTLVRDYNFEAIIEDGYLLGVKNNLIDVSIEPGSQFEIATKPHTKYSDLIDNYNYINDIIVDISEKMNFKWNCFGVNPVSSFKEIEIIPKRRYEIMREYLGKRGLTGHQMMRCTTSIQVSLDYKSEEHFSKMLRTIFVIMPIVVAWFANSPLSPDLDNDYLNKRSIIWANTDPDRCGIIPKVLLGDFSFRDYIEFCLAVPMIFERNKISGELIPANGKNFSHLLKEENLSVEDFFLHMSSIFTMARAKNYVEIRGCDNLPQKYLFGIPAFFAGLLYSDKNLEKIEELTSYVDYIQLTGGIDEAADIGFKGKYLNRKIIDWAEILFDMAYSGLEDINDEFDSKVAQKYMIPIGELVENCTTPSEEILSLYDKGGIDEVMKNRFIEKVAQ